jgi:hypothetical protein
MSCSVIGDCLLQRQIGDAYVQAAVKVGAFLALSPSGFISDKFFALNAYAERFN